MPKQKTRKTASKRFKLTGSGRIKRERAFHNHILTKKHMKRKRMMRQATIVHPADEGRVLRQLARG